MIEFIDKVSKQVYRFLLDLEGISIKMKKDEPFCSFEDVYSNKYTDCKDMKIKCGLISNKMTVDSEDISFSNGKDAKKILYLTKLGQEDPVRLESFIDNNSVTKLLDEVDLSKLESLFDSSIRMKGELSDLTYSMPHKDEKDLIKRDSATDKTIFKDGVLMLQDDITSVDSSDLEDFDNIEVMVLPKNLESIDEQTFEDCEDIKEIDFRKVTHLKEIPQNLFHDLDNLKSIVIPEGVTKIESQTFTNCECLRKITLPSTVEVVDGEFAEDCPHLYEVDMSKIYLLEEIDDSFLESENCVDEFVIPEGVSSVGCEFLGSDVKRLYVPSTVEEIGCPCSDASNLTVFLYADGIDDIYGLCQEDITLYVHESAYRHYNRLLKHAEEELESNIKLKTFPDNTPYVSEEYERISGYRKALANHAINPKKEKETINSSGLKAQQEEPVIPPIPVQLKVYIIADGKQEGPYDEEQFARLVEYGMVNTDTLVWQEGMEQWQKAGTVENLQRFFAPKKDRTTPPPVPLV